MKLRCTTLPGVLIVEPTVFKDGRGWFMESFNADRFRTEIEALGERAPPAFIQDNHSCSMAGVLRGLHYQLPPYSQGKLVRVVTGSAFDVAVDIRRGSPTFGRWFGTELNVENQLQLWIPEGFAHGFLALEDNTQFLYKTTARYASECERCICWNDTLLDIKWPLGTLGAPVLAPKDAQAPSFDLAGKRGDLFEFNTEK